MIKYGQTGVLPFIKELEQNDDDYFRYDESYLLDEFNFSDSSIQYDFIKVE
jgi:hypothetical protein